MIDNTVGLVRPLARRLLSQPRPNVGALLLPLLLAASVASVVIFAGLSAAAMLSLALLATVISTAYAGRAGAGIAVAVVLVVFISRVSFVDGVTFLVSAAIAVVSIGSFRDQLLRMDEVRSQSVRAQQWLQEVVDMLPEGIVVRDPNGRLLLTNERAADLLGAPVPLSLEHSSRAAKHRTEEATRFFRALAGETVKSDDLVVRDPITNAERSLVSTVEPLRVNDNIVGVVSTFTDITSVRNLERERTGFFSMVGHEIKTPLTAMEGQVQLVRRLVDRGAPPQRMHSSIEQLEKAIRRLRSLSSDITTLSTLRHGEFVLDAVTVDVALMLQGAVARNALASDRHRIMAELPAAPLPVSCDETRIDQVLDNLITNAIRYSDGGTIKLSASRVDHHAVLRVSDEGIGVPAGERQHLFEAFYRASNSRGRQGTGLGLYISRDIVRRSGGDLWLERTGPQGSTFALSLPLAD
jgi:signal transduction histidine kinase